MPNIILKKLDPKPDSDAEESATLDGVEGVSLNLGSDKIYLGVAISQLAAAVRTASSSPAILRKKHPFGGCG